MTTPDQIASDLEQILTAKPTPAQAPGQANLSVVLATRPYIDRKVLQENQVIRLLDTVKDEAGGVLLKKYDKLTSPVWRKYRSKPECRPIHFICETPLFILNDINVTFLIPDDFQFLGALYASLGDDMAADQFFTEALKAGSADAYINAAVFRYRRGERGVVDNFYVAKKHFGKALSVLHQSPLDIDEKTKRRKMCVDAIDEIEFRFAPWLDKLIRLIIRLLTFHFEPDVKYVGPAAPREGHADKMKEMTDGIANREFNLKKEAAKQFIADLHSKIPVAQSHLETELQEIESEYGAVATPEGLDRAAARLADFYVQNDALIERDIEILDISQDETLSVSDVCTQLAPHDDIELMAAKYKLTSLGELMDISMKSSPKPAFVAWLIRDKLDDRQIMECLFGNSTVPDGVKRVIQQRHMMPS